MSSFVQTFDSYWYSAEYDIRHLFKLVKHVWYRFSSTWYSLVLSNILSGLVILQLVYVLPFSQVFALANTTPQPPVKSPALARTARAITIVAPAPVVVPPAAKPNLSSLQGIIDNWAATHKGQYGIVVQDLSGKGRNASYNANKQFVSASIYKLYVAYATYTKLDNGEFTGDSLTSTGATVDHCLQVMITVSDNNCAHALLSKVGGQWAENLNHQKGYTNTFLASKSSFISTAQDTNDWLTDLNSGNLIRSDHQASILSFMSQQIYRNGIPAGSKGSKVADKVGFIDGYNHDAGIVYHANGTYALTIFSSGSNFTNIADLARQVSTFMGK